MEKGNHSIENGWLDVQSQPADWIWDVPLEIDFELKLFIFKSCILIIRVRLDKTANGHMNVY